MCVTPAGKIGNCTWGMPKLLPHSRKKGSLLHLLLPEQNRSSQFLFPPICRQEGIWSFEAFVSALMARSKLIDKQAARGGIGDRERFGENCLYPRIRRERFAFDDADGGERPHELGVKRRGRFGLHDVVEHLVIPWKPWRIAYADAPEKLFMNASTPRTNLPCR
jgi:hypothetical protein